MKKLTLSILLLAVMILSITAVSAADDVSLDLDDSQGIDVDSTPAPVTSAGGQGVLKASGNAEILTDPGDKNFTTLQTEIDDSRGTLSLESNYVRAEGENDILITKTMYIVGNNYKIDANNLGGIFKISGEGSLILQDVVLVNGNATEGGAIYVEEGGYLSVVNSEIYSNNASIGGAIYNLGEASITGSTLHENTADIGGAIYSEGDLSVKDTTFVNNIGVLANSIMNYEGTLALTNVNCADEKGIYNYGGKITSKVIVTILDNTTVESNAFDVVINATMKDENDNEIIDNTLSFLINDDEIEAVYNETTGLYQGNYVLPTGGLYTVNAVSSTGSTLDVETGIIRCIKGTFTDLQNKIDNAEDTLTFDYGFKYVPEIDDESYIDGVYIRRSLNIDGNGYTIDANGADSIFVISEGTVSLDNITFINSGNHAIINDAGLTITSSVFKDNFCPDSDGGAAILNRADLLIEDCAFENNTAVRAGGAICSGGTLKIINSNFTSNNATYGSAIASKSFNITGGLFSENIAQRGTIYFTSGTSTITGTTFSENECNIGGAIFISSRGSLEINSSVFTGNIANEAANAIYVPTKGTLTVTGSTFSQNGGYNKSSIINRGTLSLSENDFDNLIYNLGGNIISKTYAVVMGNTTIVPESDDVFITAIVTDDVGNIIKDNSFKFLINDEEIDATFDETLLLYEANYTLPVYGMLYTVSMSSNYEDLEIKTGAFNNVRGTFTDLQTRIDNAIAEGTAYVELPYDITYNGAVDGDLINGIYINDEVTIDGNGYYIDGNNTARIFNIDAFATVNLSDAILKNGYSAGNGGAIYASGTLNVDDCVFTNNTADGVGDSIYIAPSYQVVVIMSEEDYDAQLADPNSALNKYYAQWPGEDADPADSRGHSWAAVQAAGLKTDVSELPWIVVNLNKFNGIVDVYYDGEHKFGPWNLSGRDKTWAIISVTNPEDCGMKQFALWGNVDEYATGEVFDPNKIAVTLDGDMITPLDAMSSVSIKDSLFDDGDGYAIWNDGVLSLEGNTVSAIANNGNITSTVYAVVIDNETYVTIEDTFPINATLTDDNGNLIYDRNFQFTVNGIPVDFKVYDEETGLYTASIIIGLEEPSYVISVNDANYENLDVQIGIVKNGNVGTYTDLQAKIDAAIEAGEDTFVLPYNFTYTEIIDGGKFNSGIILTAPLTIIGNGNYIDGAGLVRIFDVEVDNVILSDIEFRNGRAPAGGAIYARSDLLIDNCTFINNTADEGNAIYAVTLLDDVTNVVITDSIFIDNGEYYEYAILNNKADITLSNNDISNVIYNNGTITGSIIILDEEIVNATFGETIILNATFVDDCGNFIFDPSFVFLVEDYGSIEFEEYNLENGVYTATYVADTLGLIEVDADLDYEGVPLFPGYLNISTANVTLTVNANDILRKQNETITVYLYDLFGNPLNLTVKLEIYDSNDTLIDTHVESTVNGTYSYNVTGLPVDSYSVFAIFYSYGYELTTNKTSFIVDEYILPGSYMDLQRRINAAIAAGNTTFVLPYDFSYIEDCDEDFFPQGVVINAPINIDGNRSTISGNNSYAIFLVNASNVNITTIILVNGSSVDGGAINVVEDAANVTISNAIFVNNTAIWGGAISWYGVNGTLDNCIFVYNDANQTGGAVIWEGDNGTITSLGIPGSFFAYNTAAEAGALYIGGDNFTVDASFAFNVADDDGGAIVWYGDDGRINDSIFYGNNATHGGAIAWYGDNGLINASRFILNNATEVGGAIATKGIGLTVENGVFKNNTAGIYGGAIYAIEDLFIFDSEFANNTAETGNAVAVLDGKLFLLNNTINTEAADVVVGFEGVIASYVNIVILDNTTVDTAEDTIVLNATIVDDMGNLINADGFEFTINGNETLSATYNNVTKVYEAEFDLPEGPGIYYINMTYIETEFLDTYIGIVRNIKGTYTDLQNKIDATEEGGILELTYDFIYTEAIDGDKFPEGVNVNKSMAIISEDSISISGNDSYRIFYINASDVSISGIKFCNGFDIEAGAILIGSEAGNVTIYQSIFVNNTAEYMGGAIIWAGDDGVLDMSWFIENEAPLGGAIYWVGNNGTITGDEDEGYLGYTIFFNNTAEDGGAIYWDADNGVIEYTGVINSTAGIGGALFVCDVADNLTVRSSIFAGDSAINGGAIYWDGDNGNITSVIFAKNTAGVGGAVASNSVNLTIFDSVFAHNEAEIAGAIRLADTGKVDKSVFSGNKANETGGAIYSTADVEITNSLFEENTAVGSGNAIAADEGDLYLQNNTINTEAADIYVSESAAIVSYVNATVLGNTTVETYGFDVVLNATVTDDMGNLIEAEGFNFLINDEEVGAVYNNETNLYEAEYTLPGISIYPVGMTYTETENLDVYIGIINNLKTGTYTDLQRRINIALENGEDLVLPYNFTYNEAIDGDDFPIGVVIWDDLNIDANGFTISANNSDVNVLTIDEGCEVTIENAIITGVNGSTISFGAVANHGDLTLNNCTIIDNTITKASYGVGGAAIYNDGSRLVINGSYIINNTAPFEGSFAAVLIKDSGVVIINNTVLADNSANLGGAIHVMLNQDPVIIYNSVFDNNVAFEGQDILSDSEVAIFDSNFTGDRGEDIPPSIVNMGSLYLFRNYVEGAVYNSAEGTLYLDSNEVTYCIVNYGTITTLTNATFLDNNTIPAQLGDSVLAYGTLTDDNGNFIWDERFNITIGDEVFSGEDLFIDVEGKIYYVNYTIEYAGLNVVSTTYDATVINIGIFDVPKANVTEFVVVVGGQDNRIPYGENATVYVSLLGIDGIGLNETITVVVNDVPYLIDVIDGEAQFNVSGLEPGDYSATGMLINNRNYNDAYATGLFTILEPEAILTIEVEDTTFGEDLMVTVTFTDADGEPLPGYVTVTIEEWEDVIGLYGETTFYAPGLAPGNYTAYVRFDGDERYGSLSNNTTFQVTRIVDYEFIAEAEITPFDEQPVLVYIALPEFATGNVTITINGTTFNATVEEGGEAIIVIDYLLDVGEYLDVEVAYSGDDYYAPGTTTVNITVSLIDPELEAELEDTMIAYTQNATIYAFVGLGATGNILVYDQITEELLANVTVEEAQEGINIAGLSAGTYYFDVVYTGDEFYYGDLVDDLELEVIKIYPELSIEVTGDLVVDGEVNITFTTPEDVDGLITILVDGEEVEYTGENGTYTVTINDFAAGTHSVMGVIQFDTNYEDDYVVDTFEISKIDPELEINVTGEAVADGNVTITIILPEDAEGFVLIDINNKSTYAVPEDGIVTVEIDDLAATIYEVSVVFTGDDKYDEDWNFAIIDVAKANSTIEIYGPDEADVGEDFLVYVFVTPETATGNYSIFIDGVDVTAEYGDTSIFDGEGSFIVSGLAAGNHTIGVQYNGDENYNASDVAEYTVEVNRVNTTEIIVVIGDEIAYGDVATVVVVLPEDATGTVRVIANGKYLFADVIEGVAIVNITDLEVGEYEFDVGYKGDGKYDGYDGFVNVTVTVADPDFEIWIEDNVIDYGDIALLEIYLNESATGYVEIYAYSYVDDEDTLLYNISAEEAREGVLIENLNAGSYVIYAKYSGDNNFAEGDDGVYLYVEKIDPELGLNATGDLVIDGNVTITFTTPEDVDGIITILVDGEEVPFTGENGTYTVTLNNFTAGTHTVIGYLTNDTNYNDLSTIETFFIDKVNTTLGIEVENIHVGENETVIFVLPEDATGYVLFEVGDVKSFAEIENGIATANISGLLEGNYTLTATYTGDDKYNATEGTATFEVAKVAEYNMTVNATSEDGNITVDVTLPEDATGTVTVTVNGTDYNGTVENGNATVRVDNLPPGETNVTISYSGDDKYEPKETNVTVENTKKDVILTADKLEMYFKDGSKFIAILTDSAGNPISNASIKITINGKTYDYKTNSEGIAALPINLKAGSYVVYACFEGDDTYNPSENVSSLIEVYATVRLVENKDLVKTQGGPEKFTVRALDKYGKPAGANEKVKMTINGKTYTVSTDANGYASLPINLKAGKYSITCEYGGTTVVNTITVKAK